MEAQRAELEHALTGSPFRIYADRMVQQGAKTINILQVAWILRVKRGCEMVFTRLPELLASGERLAKDLRNLRDDGRLGVSWREYIRDAGERAILLIDLLRESGDLFLEYEAAGCPPVLFYEYEKIMDGRDLPVKSNFVAHHPVARCYGRLLPSSAVCYHPSTCGTHCGCGSPRAR